MLNINNVEIPGLQPIQLSVAEGECAGVAGDSGCGKTRLLRAIADLDKHSSDICIDAVCQMDVPAHEWRKRVALLPAESQWWYDTVGEHFINNDEIPLAELGLDKNIMQQQVSHCSSGEKQRLAVLRVLVNKPQVLLLDEPTANLDADNCSRVEKFIEKYIQENNSAAIWVSHNSAQLKRVAKKCYLLSAGALKPMHEQQ